MNLMKKNYENSLKEAKNRQFSSSPGGLREISYRTRGDGQFVDTSIALAEQFMNPLRCADDADSEFERFQTKPGQNNRNCRNNLFLYLSKKNYKKT